MKKYVEIQDHYKEKKYWKLKNSSEKLDFLCESRTFGNYLSLKEFFYEKGFEEDQRFEEIFKVTLDLKFTDINLTEKNLTEKYQQLEQSIKEILNLDYLPETRNNLYDLNIFDLVGVGYLLDKIKNKKRTGNYEKKLKPILKFPEEEFGKDINVFIKKEQDLTEYVLQQPSEFTFKRQLYVSEKQRSNLRDELSLVYFETKDNLDLFSKMQYLESSYDVPSLPSNILLLNTLFVPFVKEHPLLYLSVMLGTINFPILGHWTLEPFLRKKLLQKKGFKFDDKILNYLINES